MLLVILRRRSLMTLPLALLLLLSATASEGSGCRWVARLDFSGVRDAPSTTPPFPPASAMPPCDSPGDPEVICSDTQYPDDVFCDLGRIRRHPEWRSGTQVVGVELIYRHPSAEETYCTAKLTSGVSGDEEFAFVGADCEPPVPDETMPPFRVADIRVLKIMATTIPVTPSAGVQSGGTTVSGDECFSQIFNFGVPTLHGAVKGGGNRSRRTVRFRQTYHNCMSSTTTAVGGRIRENVLFNHNGKRYRPA